MSCSIARLPSKKIHRVNRDLMIVWPKATARERVQEGNGMCSLPHKASETNFLIKFDTKTIIMNDYLIGVMCRR